MRVLVVEDAAAVAAAIQSKLTEENFLCCITLMRPGIDGYELLRHLRGPGAHADFDPLQLYATRSQN